MYSRQPLKNESFTDTEQGEDDECDEGDEDSDEDGSLNEEDKDEVVELEKNCYSLVIVSCRWLGRPGGYTALLCVIVNSLCQLAVIYIVGCASPEYYFGNGAWLLPISEALTTNAMKAFASLLTVFQVEQEMQDISTLFRVLTHSPRVEITSRHCVLCFGALVLQYSFALVVLLAALQLVLSRHRPMDTLWINYYVFMTLGFDNTFCRFLLFCFGLELDWSFLLRASSNGEERSRNIQSKRRGRLLFLGIPMVMALLILVPAIVWNICPMTWLLFGSVSNEDPVLMISPSLGLPQGCCPVKVKWPMNRTDEGLLPVLASVPCLSERVPGDESKQAPELYWVVWPDQKVAPNSLQIMEGRGGDGTPAKVAGTAVTRTSQMRLWLLQHGYDSDAVYQYLIDQSEGISLYRSKFMYMGQWNITGIAWEERNRIFVTARNPNTGALSPTPVRSDILLRELCAPFCWRCADNGTCLHCENGFARQGKDCLPCAEHCQECTNAGPGGCDRGHCKEGFGITRGYVAPKGHTLAKAFGLGTYKDVCKPCRSGVNCTSCDTPREQAGAPSSHGSDDDAGGDELPCQDCRAEFGVLKGFCQTCNIEHCEQCNGLFACHTCESGYTRWPSPLKEECLSCAPNCTQCDKEGAGKCDVGKCEPKFTSGGVDTYLCERCAAHCRYCNVSGAYGCNQDQCEDGYTQQKTWMLGPTGPCEACSAHCQQCSTSGPGKCDPGQCEPGFGLQGRVECSRCAEDFCLRCEESWHHCDECMDGYGFSTRQTCKKCRANCRRCSHADRCIECDDGFRVTAEGSCAACADQCRSCTKSGEGFCDEGKCEDRWTTVMSNSTKTGKGGFTCRPCVDPSCRRCDKLGPEHCDDRVE